MTVQSYLIIDNNIVTNICLWDGNEQNWAPPTGSIVLPLDTTPAVVWTLVSDSYELEEVVGAANIGFTWNGSQCVTDQPKPTE